MIVEWKEKDFTNNNVGEVIDVRHEQPGFFSKGKTIYIVRLISDNSITEVEAIKCKVKYK